MRALCPVGVTKLTVAELEQRAVDGGSLYPRELSLRLKVRRALESLPHRRVVSVDDTAQLTPRYRVEVNDQ